MYVSIDLVEEVIERQLRKYRTKISAKKYAPAIFQDDFVEADDAEDEKIKIVRTKRFGMKPMYPEGCMHPDGAFGPRFLRIQKCRE